MFYGCSIVLVSDDIKKTSTYYRDVLGFEVIEDDDHISLLRDSIEIVLFKGGFNTCDAPYSAYIFSTDIDHLLAEFTSKGAKIVKRYSDGFVLEDIDTRKIAFGLKKMRR